MCWLKFDSFVQQYSSLNAWSNHTTFLMRDENNYSVIKNLHCMHEEVKSRLNWGLSGDMWSETFSSCCLLPENDKD